MPTALQITSRLRVTPLLDILHPAFAKLYCDGLRLSLFKEHNNGPVTDSYIVENLRSSFTDEQHDNLLPLIGFQFDGLHAAILSSQTETLQTDIIALVHFQNENAACGYHVGREYYFY